VAPMETTDDTDEQAPSPTSQKRIRRRKKEVYGAHLDDMASWQLESILDDMCAVYSEAQKEDIAFSDERERDDLRMRVDGQPSARAPPPSQSRTGPRCCHRRTEGTTTR
jgi:hypothetical protein